MNSRNRNVRNNDTDMLMFIPIIIIIGAGGYYAWKNGMFNAKITFKKIEKDTKVKKDEQTENQKQKDKPKQKPDVPGVCALDCSNIPGSSCVDGKCTDPYLFLQSL